MRLCHYMTSPKPLVKIKRSFEESQFSRLVSLKIDKSKLYECVSLGKVYETFFFKSALFHSLKSPTEIEMLFNFVLALKSTRSQ